MCWRDGVAADPGRGLLRPAALVGLALCAWLVVTPRPAAAQPSSPSRGCVSCHAELDAGLIATTKADVHGAHGVTCIGCHGGNGASPDPAVAMDPAAGFKGATHAGSAAPPGAVVACGTCHALVATRMAASPHAAVFDRGCVQCHGNHDVKPPTAAMLGMHDGALCATCHGDDPGARAATAMRASVDRLRDAIDGAASRVDRLQTSGMEVSAERLALREARSQLTLSRTEMHSLDPAAVASVVTAGLAFTTQVDRAGAAALAELRVRRRGLAVSLAAILLVVVALIAKIRQIDRRDAQPTGGAD